MQEKLLILRLQNNKIGTACTIVFNDAGIHYYQSTSNTFYLKKNIKLTCFNDQRISYGLDPTGISGTIFNPSSDGKILVGTDWRSDIEFKKLKDFINDYLHMSDG